jgi:hypothetical protein
MTPAEGLRRWQVHHHHIRVRLESLALPSLIMPNDALCLEPEAALWGPTAPPSPISPLA